MGIYFLPEVNNEILLGFMNADPTHPVILGSLYGAKYKPPFEYEAKNNTKAIVTCEQLRIEFDEEKKVITITTPSKNTLEISDDGKSITLTDQHKNEISCAVALYEPRIVLEDVSFEEQPEKGLLLIHLTYTVVHTNNRYNMVYPFYLNEGTSISNV